MSFGGGWFFLAASEAISVLNRQYTCRESAPTSPRRSRQRIAARSAGRSRTMIVLILLIDQFFWKPLVTWPDRYKLELSAGEERRFWLVDLWRAASLPRARRVGCTVAVLARLSIDWLVGATTAFRRSAEPRTHSQRATWRSTPSWSSIAFGSPGRRGPVRPGGSWRRRGRARGDARSLATAARSCSADFQHSGVDADRRRHRLQSHDSPASRSRIVQILASFPANFLFPFATLGFIKLGISLNLGQHAADGARRAVVPAVQCDRRRAEPSPTICGKWRASIGLERGANGRL